MADVGHVLGGRYHLAELVGQGGMATIYRARDTKLGRDVAIKVLRGEYGSDVSFLARFQREAQAAAQLNHPNVVAVFDYGQDPVGPYIVMELVTGGDLAGALRERGPLPPTVAASIAQQVADALDAAHARGIVHRDIKPSNVLLSTGGRVKVADFGIAQAFTDAQLTMTGVTMGSVHYFSPEQARGDAGRCAVGHLLHGSRAVRDAHRTACLQRRLRGRGRHGPPVRAHPHTGLGPSGRAHGARRASSAGRSSPTPARGPRPRSCRRPWDGSWPIHTARPATHPSTPRPRHPRACTRPARPDQEPSTAGRLGWIAALIGLFVLVLAGVLLFLVIVSGAGGPAPTTDPLSTDRPQPTVTPRPTSLAAPRFVGLTISTATILAERVGLVLEEEHRQTDEAPPGNIIEQDPGRR